MKPAKPSQAVDRAQLRRQRSAQGLRLRAALEFLTNIPLEPHAQRKDERASEAVNVPSRMSGVVVSLQGKPFRHVVARGMLETEQFQRALMADGALKSRIFFACQRAYPVAVLSIRGYERSTEQAERHRPSHSGAVAGRLLLNYEVQHLADVQTYAANGTAPRSATRYFERIVRPGWVRSGYAAEAEAAGQDKGRGQHRDVAGRGRAPLASRSAAGARRGAHARGSSTRSAAPPALPDRRGERAGAEPEGAGRGGGSQGRSGADPARGNGSAGRPTTGGAEEAVKRAGEDGGGGGGGGGKDAAAFALGALERAVAKDSGRDPVAILGEDHAGGDVPPAGTTAGSDMPGQGLEAAGTRAAGQRMDGPCDSGPHAQAARSHTEPARLDAGRVIEEEEEEEEEEAEAEDDDVASAGRGAAESKSACSEGDDIDSDKTNDSVSSGEEAAQLGVKDGRALVANARDLIRLYTPMELGDSLESKPADRRFERSLEALGVRASVLGYLRPEVREEQAQAAFEEHHSWISQDLGLRLIALQRLRALLFRVREDCRLQLVTVAHAWCLLEMLVWRSRINAANMSVAMGACILLSVKFMEPPREPGPLAALLPDGQEDPAAAPTGAGGVAARWLGAGAAAAADGSGDDARAQPGPALGGATPDEEGGAGRRDGATLWRRVSSRISGVARAVSNRSGVRRWATRRRENDARASASRQGEDPATTPAGQSDSQPGSRFGRSRLDTPAGGGSTTSLPRAAGRGSATDAAQWEEGERARHVDGEDGESWESPARFPAGLGAAGAAAGASAAAAAGASAGPPGFGREAGRGRRISLGDYMPALPPGNTPLRSARALLAAVEARMGASPADVLAVEMDVFALLGFSLHLPLRILLPQVASMRRADRTRAWDVPAQPPAELLPSGQRFAATRSERRSAFLHTARKKWQDAFEASSVPETAFYAPIADAAGDVSSSSDDEDHGRATGHSQHSRSLGRGGEDDEDDGIEGIDGEDEPEEDEGQARLPEDLRAEILAKRADAMGQQQLPQAATPDRFLDPEAEGVPAELA
ncbi:hypothetical protein FNF27_00171 [Cafeteria roenbergensis]|uniref:Cyclin N-terminal domain-containing protein n=2 Tax=Cafeteria roenbergensis TaxID=33653 RepID=A0A5A8ERB5_CAFRO|nr:hypothetical protein FNF27_00171 [Cafeteria roenbergensis]